MQIAHRIDRETSGRAADRAQPRASASFLTRAFARRAVEKTLPGAGQGPPPDEGRIDLPLRAAGHATHVMMGPARGASGLTGGDAVSAWCAGCADHALCEATPETGRQHQIRVHLAGDRPPDRRRQAVRRQRGAVHALRATRG